MGMKTERRPGRRRDTETDEDLWARLSADHPSLAALDAFGEPLSNPHLLAGIVQDVVKVSTPQTRGTRTMPEAEQAAAIVADLRGEWSVKAFPESFKELCGKQSAAGVAARTGIDRTKVIRFRKPTGHPMRAEPTLAELVAIADGYRISPMYFAEYRLGVLVAMVASTITPEQTAAYLHRLGRP